MIKPPDKIYLQIEDCDYIDESTWCTDKINDTDIEYQRSSQWISVEDRLPTHNYSVLGFVVSGGLADPDPPMIDIVCYLPNKNHWLQFTGKSKDEIVTVTHWQPLPSPPE